MERELTSAPPSRSGGDAFGARLRARRRAAGLTQEALAERAGLSVRGLQHLEAGDARPHPATLEALGAALGLAPAVLARLRAAAHAAPAPPRPAGLRGSGSGAGPSNLPAPLTSFVGREREGAEVARLLATTRLLTLTGAGGVGKTRLALRVAADTPEPFPDGVWLVELAALAGPASVPRAVASAVGVREEPGHPLPATLAVALRPKRLLLLLDNCEHLLDACARLAEAVLRACPRVTILATSREALGLAGETAWRVPSLTLPDPRDAAPPSPAAALTQCEAVRLFVDRAVAVQLAFRLTDQNAAAVARICTRLDGIPLALELAAARVRALSVEQLLARLEDRFQLLTGGSRMALERHQTLRATVDWSHALLTAPERVLFRRLAVFAGGFDLEAVEAVGPAGGLTREDVLDLLTRLVDQSLVLADAPPEGGPVRYRLLDTLGQYAQHKLAEAEEVGAVRGRHAAHYLALAEQAAPALFGPQQVAWLDRLEGEHANLRAALGRLAEQAERGGKGDPGAAETALRLGAALGPFWVRRGHVGLAGEWLGRLLALPGAPRTAARARVLAGAAEVAFFRRDFAAGQRLATEGLAAAQAAGDSEGAARAHFLLGVFARRAGDAAAARAHLEASRRAADALGAPALAALSVVFLASVARDAGDEPGAAQLTTEAEALARPTGDPHALSTVLWHRGAFVALRAGDYPLARRLLEEALALRRTQRDPRATGESLAALGWVALAAGDATAARRWLTQGLAAHRDAGFRWSIPLRLRDLARVAEAQRQPARAARLSSAAAAQHQAIVGRPMRADEGPPFDTPAPGAAALRARLGDAAFVAAWADGQAMTLEQAVAYALEDDTAAA